MTFLAWCAVAIYSHNFISPYKTVQNSAKKTRELLVGKSVVRPFFSSYAVDKETTLHHCMPLASSRSQNRNEFVTTTNYDVNYDAYSRTQLQPHRVNRLGLNLKIESKVKEPPMLCDLHGFKLNSTLSCLQTRPDKWRNFDGLSDEVALRLLV